jgi:hypothetical protein
MARVRPGEGPTERRPGRKIGRGRRLQTAQIGEGSEGHGRLSQTQPEPAFELEFAACLLRRCVSAGRGGRVSGRKTATPLRCRTGHRRTPFGDVRAAAYGTTQEIGAFAIVTRRKERMQTCQHVVLSTSTYQYGRAEEATGARSKRLSSPHSRASVSSFRMTSRSAMTQRNSPGREPVATE